MEAEELRIGNLVYIGKEVNILELVDFVDIFENNTIQHFKPIPITEEWLLKFGIVKNNDGIFILRHNLILCSEMTYAKIFLNGFYHEFKIDGFVHELQNLYFALTKEELILN